jgi:hypothetical protein
LPAIFLFLTAASANNKQELVKKEASIRWRVLRDNLRPMEMGPKRMPAHTPCMHSKPLELVHASAFDNGEAYLEHPVTAM